MCRRITCNSCGRPSFAGCGAHIEQVLGDVPQAERCRCAEEDAPTATTKDAPPRSVVDWLLGRSR